MDFANLIAHLDATEEGKKFLPDLNTYIETNDTNKTELDKAKQGLAVFGDRDPAKSMALLDQLEKEGLGTVADIVELKNNAAEADKKLVSAKEIQAENERIQNEIESNAEARNKESDAIMRKARIHTALAPFAGNKTRMFELAVDGAITSGELTIDEEGSVKHKGEKLSIAIENLREEFGEAFKQAPLGTNNPPVSGERNNNTEKKPYWKK
jgi:hypothetical protein